MVIIKALLENPQMTEKIVNEYNYLLKAYNLLKDQELFKVPKPHGIINTDN